MNMCLIGSDIRAVMKKSLESGRWSIDTTTENRVDFFSETTYPFRVDVDVTGIITAVYRPDDLMARYNELVENR